MLNLDSKLVIVLVKRVRMMPMVKREALGA